MMGPVEENIAVHCLKAGKLGMWLNSFTGLHHVQRLDGKSSGWEMSVDGTECSKTDDYSL